MVRWWFVDWIVVGLPTLDTHKRWCHWHNCRMGFPFGWLMHVMIFLQNSTNKFRWFVWFWQIDHNLVILMSFKNVKLESVIVVLLTWSLKRHTKSNSALHWTTFVWSTTLFLQDDWAVVAMPIYLPICQEWLFDMWEQMHKAILSMRFVNVHTIIPEWTKYWD